MSLPFVQATFYTKGARNPARTYGVAYHMAQGGGTVSWLSRKDGKQGNNSSTLVVEYSGRVVQMVKWTDMDHSLHVKYDADERDAPDFGIYALSVAEAVLAPAGVGSLANYEAVLPYLVSVEVEGFAEDGPNPAQITALRDVVAPTLRAAFPNLRGNLGHRDFQDYKPCPGGRFPWDAVGGHGTPLPDTATGDPVPAPVTSEAPALMDVAVGAKLYALDGKTVLRTLSSALTDRYSPFAAGKRAMYATVGTVRQVVLVAPVSNVRPIAPDCTEAVRAATVAARARLAKKDEWLEAAIKAGEQGRAV